MARVRDSTWTHKQISNAAQDNPEHRLWRSPWTFCILHRQSQAAQDRVWKGPCAVRDVAKLVMSGNRGAAPYLNSLPKHLPQSFRDAAPCIRYLSRGWSFSPPASLWRALWLQHFVQFLMTSQRILEPQDWLCSDRVLLQAQALSHCQAGPSGSVVKMGREEGTRLWAPHSGLLKQFT